jgi:P-type E1-E2 ATPase
VIEIDVPGLGAYQIDHLVLDVNGTIALDGALIEGIRERIDALRNDLQVHLLTADTHGRQAEIDAALGQVAARVKPGFESDQKVRYVRALDASTVIAIGNGANDADMLLSAAIGIGILGREGIAAGAMEAADVLVTDPLIALDLVRFPTRLVATLRR